MNDLKAFWTALKNFGIDLLSIWPLWIVAFMFILLWRFTSPSNNHDKYYQDCINLGKTLHTETVYTNHCWVKGWSPE